jgi:phosphoglucosamine mutase
MSGVQQTRKVDLFGTDGIRGRANVHPMTSEVMMELGRALASAFRLGPARERAHRVLIGKDTRRSGYMLEDALASGLCSMGVEVLQVGPIPTPGLAFLTVDMRCDAGAMISASHNAFEDNGVKFFSRDGFKLPDAVEDQIEKLMYTEALSRDRPQGAHVGRARRIDDASGRYIVFLKKTFPQELSLEGMRVVVDCANGAAYRVAPTVLQELGAEVIAVGASPNGTNINAECGAVHPELLVRTVREYRADVGIALDGDADRCVLVDETGSIVDGDRTLAMCALDMKRRNVLERDTMVATTMSNLGLERLLKSRGITMLRAAVGDRYVVERMKAEKLNLGGEQSGHLVFLDHNTTGDGLLTALQVLALIRRSERSLSELGSVYEPTPQVTRSVMVRERRPLEELPAVWDLIQSTEKALGDAGRVLVRYSGTEPVARVMVEGDSRARIEELCEELCDALHTAIGERRV